MSLYKSIPVRMQKHSELIENTISDPALLAEVNTYGYSAERMTEGKTLLDTTRSLIAQQGDEEAEKLHASGEFNALREKLEEAFIIDLKIARIALRNKPALLRINLGVDGEPRTVYAEWLADAELFYGNALKSDEVLAAFGVYNRTPEYLNQQLTDIETLKSLKLKQKKEMGEAQVATQDRDKKLSELDAWCRDYKTVARIVFEDNLQVLEKLGILVRSN